ncbi:probable inactive poly [ADP-ribose] polymerase SRO2 [Ziziphus jujuba]|uniref:Probable inactive poly [ADP-ribose] polymerase SRO2 n=1 Tax=Ziziphus jujuba TaxID=326968 RepID=A0ABM3ZZN1_ZIZJJ|nr:probable inactive poly [ADP-ribose] polymerase SRO2 [Ziziphus jujuba]
MTVDDDEILNYGSETDEEVHSKIGSHLFEVFAQIGMVSVGEGSMEHEETKRSFLLGMGLVSKDTNIVAINKIKPNFSLTRQAKVKSFQIFSEAVTEKCGGDANIKHAWYGGSRDEICGIVSHGFSSCATNAKQDFHGVGVQLFPVKLSIDGALSSVADESGVRHILLCRVIIGKPEVVKSSKQFHPSSNEFDSGVDNLLFPRKYIIWNAFINSHIFPEYVISFKSPCLKEFQRKQAGNALKPLKPPKSPWISFPTLISILSEILPPKKSSEIVKCHNEFRAKKIRRMQLVQKVRTIAGDKLLDAVIKSINNIRKKS